jgi:hypothetical protein
VVILEATGLGKMQAGTDQVGVLEAMLPAGTLVVGIVRVGVLEAIGLGKTQAGTDQVGVLEAMLPAAGTLAVGIVRVGVLEAMLPAAMLAGGRVETRQLTGPEREVAGTVRQVAPLSVVRRAGNDHNRPRVRGQAA